MRKEAEYGRAFSTDQRLKVIELLQKEPSTINELAKKLSLNPITVRHHIQILEKIGAVRGDYEARTGRGRPAKMYKATQKVISLEYPKRQYEHLSDVLLEVFIGALGEKRVSKMLSEHGYKVGKKIVRDLTDQYEVKKWTLDLFKKYLVDGYLTQMGTQPEIIKSNENGFRLRFHNCVFLEVVKKYPDVMCAADEKIWTSIIESMDMGMRAETVKCMGHDDPYCEFLISPFNPSIAEE